MALLTKKALLVLLLVVVQFMAGVWYSASYIPYGRSMIKSCCRSTLGGSEAGV